MFQLAEQLSTEYRAARQNNSSENEDPQRSTATSSNATHSNKRKICQVRLCNNNKTNNICEKCQKYVCGRCTHKTIFTFICIKCTNNNELVYYVPWRTMRVIARRATMLAGDRSRDEAEVRSVLRALSRVS